MLKKSYFLMIKGHTKSYFLTIRFLYKPWLLAPKSVGLPGLGTGVIISCFLSYGGNIAVVDWEVVKVTGIEALGGPGFWGDEWWSHLDQRQESCLCF